MARVTVEDCVKRVPNRFELVMAAAQRTRDLSAGAALSVERDNDKNSVVALREIAEEAISADGLSEALIEGLQRHIETDEPEEEEMEMLPVDPDWVGSAEELLGGKASADAAAADGAGSDADLAAKVFKDVTEADVAAAESETAPEDEK